MGDENDDNNHDGSTVPSSRLRDETKAKRAALARVAELESQITDLEKRGATVETLTTQVTELRGQLEAERKGRNEDKTIFGAGFPDPDLVRFEYSRLPEKDRPELQSWLSDLKKSADKAPVSMRAFLEGAGGGGGGGGAGDATGAGGDTGRKMGADRKGGSNSTPAGGDMSLEQAKTRLTQLSQEARRTGDWSSYDKERATLLARIAKG